MTRNHVTRLILQTILLIFWSSRSELVRFHPSHDCLWWRTKECTAMDNCKLLQMFPANTIRYNEPSSMLKIVGLNNLFDLYENEDFTFPNCSSIIVIGLWAMAFKTIAIRWTTHIASHDHFLIRTKQFGECSLYPYVRLRQVRRRVESRRIISCFIRIMLRMRKHSTRTSLGSCGSLTDWHAGIQSLNQYGNEIDVQVNVLS